MISVIVPIYNVAKYLPTCIDSILTQRYRNFELLLVDDGSTDGSLDICNHYANQDKRIKVITKKNGGVSSARNIGLDNVCGDWIAFIDGDDYVNEFYLENMVNVVNSLNKTDLVVAGFTRVDDTDFHKTIDKWSYFNDAINVRRITFNQLSRLMSWGVTVSKLYKASIIKLHHIRFTAIPIKEDVVFLLNYIDHSEQIQLTEYNDYFYIQHNGSALNNNRTVDQKITQHKLFCTALENTDFSRSEIEIFARHSGVWSVISEVYSFCNNSIKRRQYIRDLDFSVLNSKCLAQYSMTKIDAFNIWLLKHKLLLVFDAIKRFQVLLLNLVSIIKT